ncbi:Hypothetical predicted protein [Podarcis lilfordi]|uniref:Uncharacterized protein n=1 Tax=Podarcis lilfordi TaxID=74358 RepID=A0AA35JPC3_9SAUR|nr:Hypothetical predicted protein [Podarcis lilfordi]
MRVGHGGPGRACCLRDFLHASDTSGPSASPLLLKHRCGPTGRHSTGDACAWTRGAARVSTSCGKRRRAGGSAELETQQLPESLLGITLCRDIVV